jgi:hypothetical protein
MRKTAFIFGALLLAGSAMQADAAAQRDTRADRGHHRWDRSYNQMREPASPAPQAGYNYGKPPVSESRTCDIKWCYPD